LILSSVCLPGQNERGAFDERDGGQAVSAIPFILSQLRTIEEIEGNQQHSIATLTIALTVSVNVH
jgi:hypothetical protein